VEFIKPFLMVVPHDGHESIEVLIIMFDEINYYKLFVVIINPYKFALNNHS